MARSIWKGPFVHPSLIKKVEKQKETDSKRPIKTWSRNPLSFQNLLVKNLKFIMEKNSYPLLFLRKWLDINLGEFAPTRQFLGHTAADKKAEPAKKDNK